MPRKIAQKIKAVGDVTSEQLRQELRALGAPTPLPVKKDERWALYLDLISGKVEGSARSEQAGKASKKTTSPKVSKKKAPTKVPKIEGMGESSLMNLKASELKELAKKVGSLTGKTTKRQYVDMIVGKVKTAPPKVTTRRVNPRKVIETSHSSIAPPAMSNCRVLVANQKLMAHQERVIDHFSKHDGLIVFHLPGSGKTLTAASSSMCWLKENPKGMVFVAVPGPLVDNFLDEGLKKFYGLSHNFIARHFVVDTYVKIVKYVTEKGLDKKPFFLIIDEAHKLKTKVRKTTRGASAGKQKGRAPKGIIELASKAKKVLVMTGTVFRNTEKDVENLVAIARKGKAENLYKAIAKYNKPTKTYEFIPSKVRDYFKCLISYYPGSASENVPTVTIHEVDVPMTKNYWENKQGTGYWNLHQTLKKYLDTTDGKKQMYVSQMREKANKSFMEGKIESPKAEWIVKMIKDDHSQKTIIYSFFKESGVLAIQAKLKASGIKSTYLKPELSDLERSRIVRAYNSAASNTDGEGIILITKATSEGLDFKGTRRIIITEKDYSPAGNQQIIARGARYMSHAHLPKNQQKVDVYYLNLVLPKGIPRPGKDDNGDDFKTIDERVEEINRDKKEKGEKFLSYIIAPEAKVTIENDPDCA